MVVKKSDKLLLLSHCGLHRVQRISSLVLIDDFWAGHSLPSALDLVQGPVAKLSKWKVIRRV
jgi:hypothetical protein